MPLRSQRSKLVPRDMRSFFKDRNKFPDFNQAAHEQLHAPRYLKYTSFADFTTPGSLTQMIRPGMLTQIKGSIQVTGAGSFTYNILKNGTAILGSDITIIAGAITHTPVQYIDNRYLVYDDYLQVSITAASTATGPLVVWIEYVPTDLY